MQLDFSKHAEERIIPNIYTVFEVLTKRRGTENS